MATKKKGATTKYALPKTKDTAAKLPKKPNPVPNNVPFVRGFDPRRNLHGRPQNFDELRALVREIGEQELTPQGLTRIGAKVMMMYGSKNSADNATLLAYGWGKVKDEAEVAVEQSGKLVIEVVHTSDVKSGFEVAGITSGAGTNQDAAETI